MKQLSAPFYAVFFTLAVFLFLPSASLIAQTNFVKYAGNPILPLGSPGQWDNVEAAFAHVSFDGSTYRMWYSGAPQENNYFIGYATSSDGFNWNKHATNPVLSTGAFGAFDGLGLWLPMVLFDGSLYEMWYSGNLDGSEIGYATAADPSSLTRHAGNPVLIKGGSGEWDEDYAFLPVVMRSDTSYQMWYSGQSASGIWQTGYATSTDGTNWSKHPNNPVLPAGASGEWDAGAALAGTVLFENGQYQMWYHGAGSPNPRSDIKIGYATSSDGLNWTKHPDNPIVKPANSGWDIINTWFPHVIKDGHRYRMWYTGRASGTTVDRLGYAEDFSQAAHTDSIRASSNTVTAGSDTVHFNAYIANPQSENLTTRALIVSKDGSVSDAVDLTDAGNGVWRGEWAVPAEARDYSVGVELNNLSAGYLHNSFDWGVSDEFSSIVTGINDHAQGNIPSQITLHQNYPNPFNPATTITFSLPKSGFVTLKVYNILGEEVATLLKAHKPAGQHTVNFDASALTSGLYYYTLTADGFKQSRKMLLMR